MTETSDVWVQVGGEFASRTQLGRGSDQTNVVTGAGCRLQVAGCRLQVAGAGCRSGTVHCM